MTAANSLGLLALCRVDDAATIRILLRICNEMRCDMGINRLEVLFQKPGTMDLTNVTNGRDAEKLGKSWV